MNNDNVRPALNEALKLLPPAMDTPEARVLLMTIGLQESKLTHRFQIVQGQPGKKGPARGLLQFERGGGCVGVVNHQASRFWMDAVCKERGVLFSSSSIWAALEFDDVLAFAAGRLLLFTDSKKLPKLGQAKEAWDYYLRVWRPGKPHPETWNNYYDFCMFSEVK